MPPAREVPGDERRVVERAQQQLHRERSFTRGKDDRAAGSERGLHPRRQLDRPPIGPYRHRLGRARVRAIFEPHRHAQAEAGLHALQREPPRHHAADAIGLVQVLAAPRAAADRHAGAISVHHQLLPGRTVVAGRAAAEEHAGGVERELRQRRRGVARDTHGAQGHAKRLLRMAAHLQPVGVHRMMQRHRYGARHEAPVAQLVAAHDHLAVGTDRPLRVLRAQGVQRPRDAPRGPQRARQETGGRRGLRIADADALVVGEMPQFLPVLPAMLDPERAGVDVQRLGQRIPAAAIAGRTVGVAHPSFDAVCDVRHARGIESDQPGHEHAVEGAGRLDAALAVRVDARHLTDDAVGQRVAELVGVSGEHPLRHRRADAGTFLMQSLLHGVSPPQGCLSNGGMRLTGQAGAAQKRSSPPSSSATRTDGRSTRRRCSCASVRLCTPPSVTITARRTRC